MRQRTLREPTSAMTWTTRCAGTVVTIRSGAPGREKERTKPQADDAAALGFALKQEWEQLKKGYLLRDTEAAPGQPRMHRYLSRGYTGALVVSDVDGNLLCNRSGEPEQLLLLDPAGDEIRSISLPRNRLAWRVIHAPECGLMLALIDHQIFAWDGSDKLVELSGQNKRRASFVSVAGTRAAWFEEPEVVVRDLRRDVDLLRIRVEPGIYGGHSLQMKGALSHDGNVLALCAKHGELQLFDVASGQLRRRVAGNFEMLNKISFSPAGSILALEEYGDWRLLAFEVASDTIRTLRSLHGPADFAIDHTGGRLALAHGPKVELFALDGSIEASPFMSFPVEHIVKRCAISWIGADALGVRTDYGCASIYAAAQVA